MYSLSCYLSRTIVAATMNYLFMLIKCCVEVLPGILYHTRKHICSGIDEKW